MSKVLRTIGLIGAIAIGVFGVYKLPFVLGKWSNKVESTVGTEYKNIKREQFEESKSYVHGKIEDLQRYKRELDKAEDEVERQALIMHIQDEFATFDPNKIDNKNLKDFLNDIMNGVIE
ncbi:MAG: hypothetical protein RSC24_06395 [Clostridium sp.]